MPHFVGLNCMGHLSPLGSLNLFYLVVLVHTTCFRLFLREKLCSFGFNRFNATSVAPLGSFLPFLQKFWEFFFDFQKLPSNEFTLVSSSETMSLFWIICRCKLNSLGLITEVKIWKLNSMCIWQSKLKCKEKRFTMCRFVGWTSLRP